jgi:hypothetical protein
MPIPAALIPPLITGGAEVVSQGINAVAQGSMNRKTRQWNERMYGRQREDALADWARVNEYNHPTKQMERLKAAGLNPNMVYGSGTSTLAAAVRPTETKSWDPKAPVFDLGQVANQYFGTKQRTQSMDLTEEEIKGKRLDNIYKDLNNTKIAEGLPFNKETIALKMDQLREDILGKRASTAATYGENERKWQMHDIMKQPTLNKTLAEIAQVNSNLETNEVNRMVLRLQADKLRAETNLLRLNSYQQETLNYYLKSEKKLEQIMSGEKIETERFERMMRVANFTSDQISKILNLTVPRKYKAVNTNINKIQGKR